MIERTQVVLAIRQAIKAINNHCVVADISGEPRWYDPADPDGGTPSCRPEHNWYLSLARELREYADQLEFLDSHAHDYDDNDVCVYCGMDGRA